MPPAGLAHRACHAFVGGASAQAWPWGQSSSGESLGSTAALWPRGGHGVSGAVRVWPHALGATAFGPQRAEPPEDVSGYLEQGQRDAAKEVALAAGEEAHATVDARMAKGLQMRAERVTDAGREELQEAMAESRAEEPAAKVAEARREALFPKRIAEELETEEKSVGAIVRADLQRKEAHRLMQDAMRRSSRRRQLWEVAQDELANPAPRRRNTVVGEQAINSFGLVITDEDDCKAEGASWKDGECRVGVVEAGGATADSEAKLHARMDAASSEIVDGFRKESEMLEGVIARFTGRLPDEVVRALGTQRDHATKAAAARVQGRFAEAATEAAEERLAAEAVKQIEVRASRLLSTEGKMQEMEGFRSDAQVKQLGAVRRRLRELREAERAAERSLQGAPQDPRAPSERPSESACDLGLGLGWPPVARLARLRPLRPKCRCGPAPAARAPTPTPTAAAGTFRRPLRGAGRRPVPSMMRGFL